MTKQLNAFPFVSLIDNNVPMYRQIYETLRRGILNGEILPGTQIPSTRSLAIQLGVSRMTVVNAYDQLYAEGYLEGKTGAGTFVAHVLPEDLLRTPARREVSASAFSRALSLSTQGTQLARESAAILREQLANKFVPFQNGLTAIDSFPFETWGRIAARLARSSPAATPFDGDLAGFKLLREAVAAHLKTARGVRCCADQVIITTGAQQGLSLINSVLLEPGDAVWMEDPGYTSARALFEYYRAKLIPVPVDERGLNFQVLPEPVSRPKLIYVTPSHQYPLGVTMSLARRLSLIEKARATGAWIIEDDYDSEFRYTGRPIASLQGLDHDGRVIYVGTFSKTIFPSVKLGCLVVPPDLVDVFTAARTLTGAHSPLLDQALLAEFISEGHFARHIRRMRTLYEERQGYLLDEVERRLNGMVNMQPDAAGMHLVGWLSDDTDDREVVRRARQVDVRLTAISDHCIKPQTRKGLVFGYAAFDEKRIRNGVAKVAEILENMAGS